MLRQIVPSVTLTVTLALALTACSVHTSPEEVAPPANNEKTSAGPYQVAFDATTKTYQHSFEMDINQADGKVEYYVNTPEASEVEFVNTSLKVTGCAAGQVNHQTYWVPDSSTTAAQSIAMGSTFKTRAGVQGTFLHVLRGLTGCSHVSLSTTLKKKQSSSMKCKESSDTNCRVDVYCKEDGIPTNYIEVEVWKESWATTLRKFMNHGDGSRSLMNMNSVILANNSTETTYTSNSGSSVTYLKYNNQTLVGIYSQDVMGTPVTTTLRCSLPQ
jgi:hypothetical protein